jgi:Ser/Thr protein kinase RdoA (MazF antagonist)
MKTKVSIIQEDILSQYELIHINQISTISIGLIHQSFLLSLDEEPKYVLQGLHHQLSTDEILEDYERVTSHLAEYEYGGPQLVKTNDGSRVAEGDGLRWRLSTYVPGDTFTEVSSDHRAFIGGQGLAQFHRVMNRIDYTFKSQHPGHDTIGHLTRLIEASENPSYRTSWDEISHRGMAIIEALSEALLPSQLPRQVVHGDPKISNLRFCDDQAIMIDLDTCNRHTRLVDLGDAVRSWCHRPKQPIGQRFSIDTWQALMKGYISEAHPLSPLEIEWLPKAGYLITLELASRFTRDYLEDHYFAYDKEAFPSRRAHNRYRMDTMWALAEEMKVATAKLSDFTNEILKKNT